MADEGVKTKAKAMRSARRTAPSAATARAPLKTPRRTQAERSETTRKKLIEAALVLLRERGYGGLRTNEVSDLAGVSRGAQLHHFPTKHELILATFGYLNDRMLAESRRRAAAAHRSADPIGDAIADAKEFFFSDYFFVSLAITMGDARDEDLMRHTVPMAREARFAAEKLWIEALVARGIPRKLASDLLALTLSIVRGLAVRRFIDNDPKKFDDLLRRWRSMAALFLEHELRQPSKSTARSR
ncbi:MAG: TetR family transcriptional regulator [Hyphomicrobiales bacterium]|nr:TetR family transcriptional regulator [Hyphomicrobiales bacterium]